MKRLTRIFVTILTISLLFCNTAFAYTYEEVEITDLIEPASDWAQSQIEQAKADGLLTPSTSLFFTSDITRVQFSELVVNMVEKAIGKEISSAAENTFIDSKNISVLKAYKSGIVAGISKTTFEPETLITREQIAIMLYRSIIYIEKEKNKVYLEKKGAIDNYTDKNQVSTWAKVQVGIIADNNIMSGTSKTTLSPKNNATIEQCIILVSRLYNKVNK